MDLAWVTESREAAVYRIQEILKHPDDLVNKLSLVRKKLVAERASIDAQLRTAVERQLDEIDQGIQTLDKSGGETGKVLGNLTAIDQQWAQKKNNISNYGRIKKNFVATKELVEQFQKLNAQVARVQRLLQEDAKDATFGDNLLFLHYYINQLESFRNTTLFRSRRSSADVLGTLNHYFEKVDEVADAFEKLLWLVGGRTLELVKLKKTAATLRLVKIIETEERADELMSLAEYAGAGGDGGNGEADGEQGGAEVEQPRQMKGYRIKFIDVLREVIGKQVRELYELHQADLPVLLSATDLIVDDLILVHDELEPRFPKKYNIFQFFVLEYHRCIYDMVNLIISGNMEAGAILMLLKWVREYYSSMNMRLGVGEELLEPRLLDDREEELIVEYIKLVRQKLAEWLNNLLNTETRDFVERTGPPEIDSNGVYLLTGSVIVFQMFNQQVDVVAQSSRGELIYDVIFECCQALEEFQKAWTKILEKEYQRFTEKPGDVAEGLPEYVIALANDNLRGTEFSEVISNRVEGMMDEPFRKQATVRIKDAMAGFMKVAKRCYCILVEIVAKDLSPALTRFYCNEWYDQDLMRLVVGTLEDYCSDFQERMQEYLFSKFTADLQDRVVVLYVESLRNRGAKFRMPQAVDKMKEDHAAIIEFFSKHKSPKRVQAAFEVMERIIGVVESTAGLIFLAIYPLWKAFPDIPVALIEEILQKRDDLDKAQVRTIMEQCNSRFAEDREKDKAAGKEPKTTIFSTMQGGKHG
ncbi:SNARE-binding exocyst subunit S6 [Irineochytrium annulatum]|nr:SNARE-binding exocyst subunit S6 [Irineochytrium annulatum]